MNPCNICSKPIVKKCVCQILAYCSTEHQKADWKNHRSSCFLVQEKSTASLGRVLVAAKDFRPGEHVLTEAPLYSGPKGSDTKLVCLGCYVDMDAITGNACSSCRWPLCPDCKENPNHSMFECLFFRKNGIEFETCMNLSPTNKCVHRSILILRMLLDRDSENWVKALELQSEFSYKGHSASDAENVDPVGKYFLNSFDLDRRLALDSEWEKINRILQINAFAAELCLGDGFKMLSGIFLYNRGSKFAHSCSPNCSSSIDPDTFRITVRAAVPIRKGGILSIEYAGAEIFYGTHRRQAVMRSSPGFTCRCSRCLDPTESGVYFSAWICPKCRNNILPVDPLDENSVWKCDTCAHPSRLSGTEINAAIATLYQKVQKYTTQGIVGSGEEGVRKLNEIMTKYSGKRLHPNHWVLFQAGTGILRCTTEKLKTEKNLKLYREIAYHNLRILDKLAPGISAHRARLQLRIAACAMCEIENNIDENTGICRPTDQQLDDLVPNYRDAKQFFKHITNDHDLKGLERIRALVAKMSIGL